MFDALPHFVMQSYKKAENQTSDINAQYGYLLQTHELLMRYLTLVIISQYVYYDPQDFVHLDFNALLLTRLSSITPDICLRVLKQFESVYQERVSDLFMRELEDVLIGERGERFLAKLTRLTSLSNDRLAGQKVIDKYAAAKLVQEVRDTLSEIAGELSFLSKYALMQVDSAQDSVYEYTVFRGSDTHRMQQTLNLSTDDEVAGLFFVINQENNSCLKLFPLMVFWKEFADATSPVEATSLFHSYNSDSVRYLDTVQLALVTLSEYFPYIKRILATLERREPLQSFSWRNFRSVGLEVSRARFSGTEYATAAALYQGRHELQENFNDFVKSDKTGFILLGKSGVGKSSFVRSLLETFDYDADLSILFYHAANVDVEKGLASTVYDDLSSRLEMPLPITKTDFWQSLPIFQDVSRRFILGIDAINESSNPPKLLQQINELVEQLSAKPVKILVTCRPELWRVIKRKVRVSRTRYWNPPETSAQKDLTASFDCSWVLQPFTVEEIALAYEKYRAHYRLEPAFTDLRHDVRQALRDPYILWIVAETYGKLRNPDGSGTIPEDLQLTTIYRLYLRSLVTSGRLEQIDIQFLQKEIIPLMIRVGEFTNQITAKQISTMYMSDGRSLHDAIHNAGTMTNNQQVNQSFINLASADILALQGEQPDSFVQFKHERLYEFFGGEHLAALLSNAPGKLQTYRAILKQIADKAYLFGVVRQALIIELESGAADLIQQLCFSDYPFVVELMQEVLTRAGSRSHERVESILQALIRSSGRQGGSGSVRAASTLNAKAIALSTAHHLRINDILLDGMTDADGQTRAVAVRYSFLLWHDDHAAGFDVLRHLADRATRVLNLPRIRPLESCFVLSLVILFHGTQGLTGARSRYQEMIDRERRGERNTTDSEISTELQAIWQGLLTRVLHLRSGVGAVFGTSLLTLIRPFIYVLTSRVSQGRTGKNSTFSFNPPEISRYFGRSLEEKQLLVQVLDAASGSQSIRSHWDTFKRVAKSRDALTIYVSQFALYARMLPETEDVVDLTLTMLEDGTAEPKAALFVPLGLAAFETLTHAMDASLRQKIEPRMRQVVLKYLDEHRCRVWSEHQPYVWSAVSHYLDLHYRVFGRLDEELFRHFVTRAVEWNDEALLNDLMKQCFLMSDIYDHTEITVEALKIIYDLGGKRVEEQLTSTLSILYPRFADMVEDFMALFQFDSNLKTTIRANVLQDSMDLLFMAHSWFIATFALNLDSPLSQKLVTLLRRAPAEKNLGAFVNAMLQTVVSTLLEGDLLQSGQADGAKTT